MIKNIQRGLLSLLLVSAILITFLYREQLDVEVLEAWVDSVGSAGPLLFVVLHGVATVLILPGLALTLSGGVLFGPV